MELLTTSRFRRHGLLFGRRLAGFAHGCFGAAVGGGFGEYGGRHDETGSVKIERRLVFERKWRLWNEERMLVVPRMVV